MPKLKTKSGAKKRFRVTATGLVKASPAYKRHNLRRRSQKMKRSTRGMEVMAAPDQKLVRSYMPYLPK